jgi:DNA-directed RNA polymerase II subunit RPB1
MSVLQISNHDTYVGDEPKPNGLFDVRLGVLDQDRLCPTDLQNNRYSPGYFGHIELAKPVFNGIYMKYIVRILQMICFKCAKLRLNYDDLVSLKYKFKAVALKSADLSQCERCGAKCPVQIQLQKDSHSHSEIGFIEVVWRKEKETEVIAAASVNVNGTSGPYDVENNNKDDHSQPAIELVDAETVRGLFIRIPDIEVKLMGFNPYYMRPEWLIISSFPVPPPTVRPSVHSDNNTRMEDDLTHKICDIFKIDTLLRKHIDALKAIAMATATPEEAALVAATDGKPLPSMWVRAEATAQGEAKKEAIRNWYQLLYFHMATYENNSMPKMLISQQRNGRSLRSMKDRLEGKEGRVRWNLMGKRVDFSARSVITPDPLLAIDDLGVPYRFCKILTIPETVTFLNIEKLTKLCENGAHVYPGANSVLEKTTGKTRNLKLKNSYLYLNKKTGLRLGDIVNRHLLTGDFVLFNRQPSLHRMSMMTHKVRPHPGLTFRLNQNTTTPYNADFDGDEMNMHAPQSYATRIELELASVESQIISPGNHKPIIAAVQDGLVGGKIFTSGFIFLTQTQASRLLSRVKFAKKLGDPEYKPGTIITTTSKKVAYHLLLWGFQPITQTSFLVHEPMYSANQLFSAILPEGLWYRKGDVIIEAGTLISGTIRDAIMGKTSYSLIHVIFNEYGSYAAKTFLNNYNWLMNDWMQQCGFSVGIKDLMLPKEMYATIREHITKTLNDLEQAREELCFASRTNTVQAKKAIEFRSLETQSLATMANFTEQSIKKYKEQLLEMNRLYEMEEAGSKGKMINITQMSAALGAQHVDGKKIECGLNDRVLPHHHKFDDRARSHGFIPHSLLQGLDPTDCFFHAMCGREGLIDTAVKTGHTGYIQRKLVKALEDAAIASDFTVRDVTAGYIISFSYGYDGMDPARIEHIFLPIFRDKHQTIDSTFLSDGEIYNRYMSSLEDDSIRQTFYPHWSREQWAEHVVMPSRDHVYAMNLFRKESIAFKSVHQQSPDDIVFVSPINFERIISSIMHQKKNKNLDETMINLVEPDYVLGTISRAKFSYGALSHTFTPDQMSTLYSSSLHDGSSHITLNNLIYISFIVYLSVQKVTELRLSREEFDEVCEKIDTMYMSSIAPPGELSGTISAQSMGEPATQMTLRTFHFAGVANRASMNQGVPRLQELLHVSKNIKTPCTVAYLKPEAQGSAEKIMNSIVRTKVRDVCNSSSLQYCNKTTREYFASIYKRVCPRLCGKIVFYPWMLVLFLDQMKLMEAGVSLMDVWSAVDKHFQTEEAILWIHLEHAPPEQCAKLYICMINAAATAASASASAQPLDTQIVLSSQDQIIKVFKAVETTIMNDIVVKGLSTIGSCNISTREYMYQRDECGRYTHFPEKVIEAHGPGLLDVMMHPDVDQTRTISNDIYEIYTTLGIEAARLALYKEIHWVFVESSVYVSSRHIELLVDMMTCRGYLMSFDRHGINRSSRGPLSKCTFEETPDTLFNAAIMSEFDSMKSVSANIMFGQLVPIGTGSTHIMIDETDPEAYNLFVSNHTLYNTGVMITTTSASTCQDNADEPCQLFD